MKLTRYFCTILLVLIMTGCEACDNSTTGPDIPDPNTTTTVPVNPPVPPPDDPYQYPMVSATGGQLRVQDDILKAATAFVLPIRSREYAYDWCVVALSHGVNTARVFIEARNWTKAPWYLAQVAFDYDPVALEEVAHGLGMAGCAMELVLNATVKEESRAAGDDLIRAGIKQFKQWPNVLYSMVNEYKHPSSVYGLNDAKHFLNFANSLCPQCIIGVDEALDVIHEHQACGVNGRKCDFIAWHPGRNDPRIENIKFFSRTVTRSWGKPTFFDELIAHATDQNMQDYPNLWGRGTISCNGRGTEQCRYDHANRVYNLVLNSGGNPCWHTIDHMLLLIAPSAMAWPQEH